MNSNGPSRHLAPRETLDHQLPFKPYNTGCRSRFFKEDRLVAEENKLKVIHDLAYADLVFDGYRAPINPAGKGGQKACG